MHGSRRLFVGHDPLTWPSEIAGEYVTYAATHERFATQAKAMTRGNSAGNFASHPSADLHRGRSDVAGDRVQRTDNEISVTSFRFHNSQWQQNQRTLRDSGV